jgi:hypothetical protein
MASEFDARAREFRDALYEALAGASTVRDADPVLLIERLLAAVTPAGPQAATTLEPLREVAIASSIEDAVAAASRRFESPQRFRETIYFARCLQRDAETALSLLHSRQYIEDANVPLSFLDLATDRRAVLDVTSFASLWQDPARIEWLQNTIALWKRDFAAVYTTHHGRYRDAIATIAERIDAVSARGGAVERLNTLSRLGPPLAVAALAQLHDLERLYPCSVEPQELTEALANAPACPACAFELTQAPPIADTRRVLQAVERGLTAQQTRLARRLISRIIGRAGADGDERLERFVQAVQAADLNGLALVLDDSLIEFIRELLEAPASAEGVLTQLARDYPEVTDANIEAAVSEFRRLLEAGIVQRGAVSLRETRP